MATWADNDSMRITQVLDLVPASTLPFPLENTLRLINFRGRPVPVIDLRVDPFAGSGEYPGQICILTMENSLRTNIVLFGALVDSKEDAYQLINGSTH